MLYTAIEWYYSLQVGNSQITSGKIHTRADTGFDILYGR
jgi:hypothetical protein